MRSLALAALLLVACSDDPVGRGNLPAHAGFRITVDSVSEERCRERANAYAEDAITFDKLDTDEPLIYVPLIADPCSWDSDTTLRCLSTGGDFAIDFASESVTLVIEVGDVQPACVMTFAMGEIVDLDAQ